MKTSVVIIGGGPSGLLLSQLLHLAGVESVVLERRTRDYVLSRIRAGVLERGTQDLLDRAEVGARMHGEGLVHDGFNLSFGDALHRIDLAELADRAVMVYGQTEVTKDLYDARDRMGGTILHAVEDVTPYAMTTSSPFVTYRSAGAEHRLNCDFIIGCDGFHGVSRQSIPAEQRREFSRAYPFGWLGVLSETKPAAEELIYAVHEDGFALCSMRNAALSRYYIQCAADEDVAAWSDDRFWSALKRRLPREVAEAMETGPSVKKSIAPLRSYVCETMRYGRLLLAGDAAHIVPPTGAKGLNLAASDIHYLSEALIAWYRDRRADLIDGYEARALARVWKCERFSWWMTSLLHQFPDTSPFDARMRQAELDYLVSSRAAMTALAENYVGLPY